MNGDTVSPVELDAWAARMADRFESGIEATVEVEADLAAHGFALLDVRDAPDRPGLEDVYVTRRVG